MRHRTKAAGWVAVATVVIASFTVLTPVPASAVGTIPLVWEAGGLSAGTDSAGQAGRVATDPAGNVAVVSGPSLGRDLAVTSYTSSGAFRWRGSVSPASGTFRGDWVAAAPNGDVVAVGTSLNSSGGTIAITVVRFSAGGALQWRVDINRLFPSVGRLLVDSGGNAYLAFNALGNGQDIEVHKYSPTGSLLWSRVIATAGFISNDIATSLAFSPDQSELAVTGDITGGATWITALLSTATGLERWRVTAPEGIAALDAVVDASRVYVVGQGNVGITGFLTVVAYDRATGARLWRTDTKPGDATSASGARLALAPDGSLVATGTANRGFLDWYTVALTTTGSVRWEAVRDGGLNTDEIPAVVLVLADGTSVVSGKGGPALPGGYIPGVTAGYSSTGTLLWEAFSPLAVVWATTLPNGDVCATGGYDAYIACFRPGGSGGTTTMHVADLDASAVSTPRRWTATVTVTVRDDAGAVVSGATVTGTWRRGTVGTCTTTAAGTCALSMTTRATSEVFTITGLVHPTLAYAPASNTDPDGDSTGTSITILKP